MTKSVMVLALGDIYWTSFALHFSRLLSKKGIPCILVLESRAGEYQSFLRRCNYPHANIHYLTDFINNKVNNKLEDVNCMAVMCDYLRVEMLGQKKKLYSTDWNMVASYIKEFTDHIINQEKIGVIIGDQVSTSLSYNFCEAAEKNGIHYWGLAGSRLTGRYVISRSIKSEDKIVGELYKKLVGEEEPMLPEEHEWATKYLKEIDTQIPDYMRSKRLNSVAPGKFFRLRFIKSMVGSLLYTLFERTDKKAIVIKDAPLSGVLTATVRNFARWIKMPAIRKYLVDDAENEISDASYYVYPVHYQPEASTVIASPFYSDQLNLIKNLAFSLPPGVKLVVKEHLSNVGFPPISFYKSVKSLPNVVLASHHCNIKELIRKSLGVITLTSTAGFEALLLDKPVFHFGDVFYTYHPNAIKVDGWADMQEILAKKIQLQRYNNIAFLVAYRRYTKEGSINFEAHDFAIADDLLDRVQSFMMDAELH